MIEIKKSATADTRTCDYANVTKETLLTSSRQHIGDVGQALALIAAEAERAGRWADELDAALSALAPSGAGWQPIATAPKENWKYVLAWDASAPKKGVRMAYRVGSTWSTVSGGSIAPTHWQPLPAPPTQEAE